MLPGVWSKRSKDPSSQARILVVEQEEWCREFLSAVIKLCGFLEFRLTATVAEALAAMEDGPFDLVITDLRQPEYQRLLDHTRTLYPSTRFILMVQHRSSYHQVIYAEQVDIVFKPLTLDDIARKIRHAIHQKQLRQTEDELRRLKQEAFRIFMR